MEAVQGCVSEELGVWVTLAGSALALKAVKVKFPLVSGEKKNTNRAVEEREDVIKEKQSSWVIGVLLDLPINR